MDNEVIEHLFKKVRELSKETQTLYDLGEADMIMFAVLMKDLPMGSMSPKLLARLLRAASHFIERNEDIANELAEMMKRKK
jgi:hypothetical protein